jgi:hypothetical protein
MAEVKTRASTPPPTSDEPSVLRPIPEGHGFVEGDRIEMPLYARGGSRLVRGRLQNIDITFRGRRYKGLVLLGDDNLYYEFHPEIAKILKSG